MVRRFFRRSGSKVSIQQHLRHRSVLRAPQVSLLTLCPLAQPEKAIGHESQIEPWLTLTTTLLDASETDERRYASKMNLENRENRGSSYQYMGWMSEKISLRLPVAGGVFFLDIPFYRAMLHTLSSLTSRPLKFDLDIADS